MALDYTEFVRHDGGQIASGYSGKVVYRGQEIGRFHNCNASYPYTVETLDQRWSSGFTGMKDALKELHMRSTMASIQVNIENLCPKEYWILRIAQFEMLASPDPAIKPVLRCRLYYNSHFTTVSSTASKPALFSPASVDPETFEITCDKKMPKDFVSFTNAAEMSARIKEEVECLI